MSPFRRQSSLGCSQLEFLFQPIRLVALGVCVWLAPCGLAPQGARLCAECPQSVFQSLPSNTVLAVATDHYQATEARVFSTGVAQALRGDAFARFREALQNQQPELDPREAFPLPWETASDLLSERPAALLVIETPEQLPETCYWVGVAQRKAEWSALIEQELTAAKKRGGKVESASQADAEGWQVTYSDPAKNAAFLLTEQVLVCGPNLVNLTAWFGSAPNAQTALTKHDAFLNTVQAVTPPQQAPGDVWLFANPLRLKYLNDRTNGSKYEDFSETFAARHGFDAIRSVGGWIGFGGESEDVRYRFRVWVPRPYKGGMRMLDWQAMEDVLPSEWVPRAATSSYTAIHWNLLSILPHLGPIANEAIGGITGSTEETFENILERIKADDGPGIDLQADLMPLLGPRIEIVNFFTPPASETAAESVVAIQISDDREVADLLELLVEGDEAVKLRIAGFSFPLWKLGSGRRAGDRGPAFETPGIMVANDRLFIAANYKTIQQHIIGGGGQPKLRKHAPYISDSQRLDGWPNHSPDIQNGPAIRIHGLQKLDFQNTYELYRTGRAEQAESVYTTLLNGLTKDSQNQPPLALLPPFSAIEPALGTAVIEVKLLEDDTWEISGTNTRGDPSP